MKHFWQTKKRKPALTMGLKTKSVKTLRMTRLRRRVMLLTICIFMHILKNANLCIFGFAFLCIFLLVYAYGMFAYLSTVLICIFQSIYSYYVSLNMYYSNCCWRKLPPQSKQFQALLLSPAVSSYLSQLQRSSYTFQYPKGR